MSIYTIDVHHWMHTCPADPEPHPIVTARRIVHVVPGRDCLTPVTIATRTVPCGTTVPRDRQCRNCRTVVTIRTVTTTDLGYQGPAHMAPAHEGPR